MRLLPERRVGVAERFLALLPRASLGQRVCQLVEQSRVAGPAGQGMTVLRYRERRLAQHQLEITSEHAQARGLRCQRDGPIERRARAAGIVASCRQYG